MEEKIKAVLVGDKISSNTEEAFKLLSSQRFGEKIDEKIFYSLSEALYLVESGKMDIFDFQNKKIGEKKIFSKFQRIDRKFRTKYFIFRDLRKRGLIVKTGLKFGAEFRVYQKGASIGKEHAKWILFPVDEHSSFTWHDFSAKNRVAHSTKKALLLGIVDEEGDVSYYEVQWIKP